MKLSIKKKIEVLFCLCSRFEAFNGICQKQKVFFF
jgi:hypothetical protein